MLYYSRKSSKGELFRLFILLVHKNVVTLQSNPLEGPADENSIPIRTATSKGKIEYYYTTLKDAL